MAKTLVEDLEDQTRVPFLRGILIRSQSYRGVAEEAPGAYKDVNAVVDAAETAGLARKAGLSARSSLAVLRALHQAMAELVFDYRDQIERSHYAGRV